MSKDLPTLAIRKLAAYKQGGFTLIELLIVMAIIGALAAVIISILTSQQDKARDAKRMADLKQYQTAIIKYASGNNGLYPVYPGGAKLVDMCGVDDLDLAKCEDDPTGLAPYWYISDPAGKTYAVYSSLEKEEGLLFIACSTGESGDGGVPPSSDDYCTVGTEVPAVPTSDPTTTPDPTATSSSTPSSTPLPTGTSTPEPPTGCTDTDNGKDYYTYGEVTSPVCPAGQPDKCVTSIVLHESFCQGGSDTCWIASYHCISGCVNGVCNPLPPMPTPGPTSTPVPFPEPTPSWQPSFPCTSYPCGWCLDSDGGKVGSVKGTVHRAYQYASGWPINEDTIVDSCRDEVYLTEQDCGSLPGWVSQSTIICYTGCYDGACL